ncbi:uncharacterized protein I206_100239 [Kwoniella pini CBS 10737]|uniref:RING-type domain-containing protein n=1 Tax=Kwoniella pini CBS 10737 TaxID=1296096 RepID=A0A1B9IDS3_9TREE|nr:uncharacterized protein I206_01086 [Kwoniella pini CBS 10737]OCF53779.1 hypothetical protein I206_01086 [Kwoniella pini CBS 10737]
MSESENLPNPLSSPIRPIRQAKRKAIMKIDKAVPKEKEYKRKREKEKRELQESNKRKKKSIKNQALAINQLPSLDINQNSSSSIDNGLKIDLIRETFIPLECVICTEDIIELLDKADKEGKGGIGGGLVLWTCEQKDCGALFCITCVINYVTFPGRQQGGGLRRRENLKCPTCTRIWDLEAIKDQVRAYDANRLDELGI